MLKSLGLVWIPGVMAGMMVSGASPVYAGIFQFIIVAMILSASGITGLIVTLLMQKRAFSPAAQLTLRPGERLMSAPHRPGKSVLSTS
jgi:putative ABC transport system permease protein